MKFTARVITAVLVLSLSSTLQANKYGSVEPIANPAVIDTTPLSDQPLRVREAFASRLLQCGVVDRVVDVLSSTRAITTINNLNTSLAVGAGGFAGETNPAYVYTILDAGPNAASIEDVKVLTDSLGYVLSQGSAFLLDSDDPSSFDFPANYVVLNFPAPPSIATSAALFRLVGRIDPELFETDSSGYTQFGRAYLSLQSFVPDQQFIDGYVEAAAQFGVEYTPIINGTPALFQGGAAFPGNDWTVSTEGEEYLARLPVESHRGLGRIRAFVLRVTREVLRKLEHDGGRRHHDVVSFDCR
ncbi:MAG TPA: hypothetical protein VHI98_21110 [Vicinamibacterales bacterium]|jgi:hypothetical protein|nr:hypothetical protein [Vicinamibacterales bacterium]